ncbi:MAG: bifunctional diaminohydroxyphosphoribosylaminopyrimidine deaminase/5-amino-6-(5-phosphoribosylamino)uracil reductase RibD [Galactobacter sp.]
MRNTIAAEDIAVDAAMDAALDAALAGHRGANPLVGAAVLSPEGHITTGFHAGAGTPHAEIQALREARADGVDLTASTLVVTLEPCHHSGRTGPCTQAILDAGIPEVVFALPDPHAVAGGGADALRAAGIHVRSGVRQERARALNAGWLRAKEVGRPFVTAKTAQSLDGYAAAADGTSRWITGTVSRVRAHEVRAEVSAIIVGTGTALSDDPQLTARDPDDHPYPVQPVPVVIGERELPADSTLARREDLLDYRPGGSGDAAYLHHVLSVLGTRGHEHVLVEGGPTLVGAFLDAGLVDHLMVFTAPLLLGSGLPGLRVGPVSTLAEAHRMRMDPASPPEVLGDDVLTHFVP